MTDQEHAQEYDVAIVGGGAAGLSAALLLTRARRRVLVVDARSPRNASAEHMQGFLSRDGMPPQQLLEIGREEVLGYGGVIVTDYVEKAEAVEDGFTLALASGVNVRTAHLLVATGLTDALPGIPGVRERWGREVQMCPYCHGWEVRDQAIGVLGTSDHSVLHALLVREWSEDVIFFPNETDLDDDARTRLAARSIRIAEGRIAGLAIEDDHLVGVRLADGTEVARSAVFLAAQPVPNDSLLTGLGCATDAGWVTVDASGRTSVPRVWAAGNVVDQRSPVINSAAAGTTAAAAIHFDLVTTTIEDAVAALGQR